MPILDTCRRVPPRYLPAMCIMLVLAMACHALADDARGPRLEVGDLSRLEARAAGLERLHALVVAQRGEIVFERRFAGPGVDRPANIKSLSKTVLAALVGAAIERGLVDGTDQPVAELLGPLVPSSADPRVNEITVGHLLSLQAGLERTSGSNYGAWVASPDWVHDVLTRPFVDRPGGRMLYSTGSSHLLSAALTQASGENTLALARRWLGEPLNIAIPAWPRDPQGIYFGGNDMQLSPRALVRLGELYRNDGVVDGIRVLPEGWVEASWQPRGTSRWTRDGYGYGWFVTTLAGERAYYGRGFGGQALFVVPSRELTVVVTADPTPPSPGGLFQRAAIADHDVFPADIDQAFIHELAHRARHRFARRSDHLGDGVVGQAARDALAVGLVGEIEQQLGHASVHIEEHQAADLLVDAAQAPGQLAQQRERDAGRVLEDALEIFAAQHEQRRVFHRDDVRGARLVVDQRHLAEELALAEDGQDDFSAILADQDDFDLALGDDVERVTGIVFEEDDGVLRVGAVARDFHHPLKVSR